MSARREEPGDARADREPGTDTAPACVDVTRAREGAAPDVDEPTFGDLELSEDQQRRAAALAADERAGLANVVRRVVQRPRRPAAPPLDYAALTETQERGLVAAAYFYEQLLIRHECKGGAPLGEAVSRTLEHLARHPSKLGELDARRLRALLDRARRHSDIDRARGTRRESGLEAVNGSCDPLAVDPAEWIVQREAALVVERAILELPPAQRDVTILIILLGGRERGYANIVAGVLGLKPPTVRELARKGRLALAHKLGIDGR